MAIDNVHIQYDYLFKSMCQSVNNNSFKSFNYKHVLPEHLKKGFVFMFF